MPVPPFIILALPRSRTAWLSKFLSYPPKRCGHDIAAEANSIQDFLIRLARVDGTVETGAVLGWKLIRRYIPQATIIVVKRPLREIRRSFAQLGIVPVAGELEERRAMLDACARSPGVTEVAYNQLNDPNVCAWIFETCLGLPFDEKWHARLAKRNIQIDVPAQMERLRHRHGFLTKLKSEVAGAVKELEGSAPCLAAP